HGVPFNSKPDNPSEGDPAVRSVPRNEPGPIGPGSGLVVVAEEGRRGVTVESHVTEFERDRLFGLAATFSGVPLHLRWRLDPDGGGTTVTAQAEAEIGGALALAGGFIQGMVKDRLSRAHANLKR